MISLFILVLFAFFDSTNDTSSNLEHSCNKKNTVARGALTSLHLKP